MSNIKSNPKSKYSNSAFLTLSPFGLIWHLLFELWHSLKAFIATHRQLTLNMLHRFQNNRHNDENTHTPQ